MNAGKSTAELREELRLVDEDLASLQRTAAELREQVGQDEPGDFADKASILTATQEQEALIASMQARRTELRRLLGED
jgi:hypothetical protein